MDFSSISSTLFFLSFSASILHTSVLEDIEPKLFRAMSNTQLTLALLDINFLFTTKFFFLPSCQMCSFLAFFFVFFLNWDWLSQVSLISVQTGVSGTKKNEKRHKLSQNVSPSITCECKNGFTIRKKNLFMMKLKMRVYVFIILSKFEDGFMSKYIINEYLHREMTKRDFIISGFLCLFRWEERKRS